MRSNLSPVENLFGAQLNSQLPPGSEKFREASDRIQKTAISLGPLEAGLLQMQVRLHGRPKWIEIGTLTGFSAFCLAHSLPSGGHLWTFEKDGGLAASARGLLRDSGVGSKVTVIEGDAIQTLRSIEDQGPFDGIFIDGNKGAYSQYLDWAERNLSVGALVIADNVFLAGSTFKDPGSDGRWSASVVQGMRDLISRLLDPEKYEACLLPTSEGLLIARKKF